MMSENGIKQTNFGKGSSNLAVVVNNENSAPAQEIKTLVAIIEQLSKDVVSTSEAPPQGRKDIHEKFLVRFKDYLPTIQVDYYERLKPRFESMYVLAVDASDASETRLQDIAILIQIRSEKCLDRCNGDPIKAIEELVEWLLKEIGKAVFADNKIEFSENAIRYYVYKQFELCNAFPNPKKETI